MHDRTRVEVDQWWRDLFDVDDELWSSVTVLHPHGQLGDYDGWYVAWRESGVHISAPSTADANEVRSLRDEPATSLQRVDFWHAFARQRGLDVVGPGVHRYVDVDPGEGVGVHLVEPSELRALRDEVGEADWPPTGSASSATRRSWRRARARRSGWSPACTTDGSTRTPRCRPRGSG